MVDQDRQCKGCGGAREVRGGADAESREVARLQFRKKTVQGRRLNAQVSLAGTVPRVAQGVFEDARFAHMARMQTGLLERASGKPQYLSQQDAHVGVIESYFIVHHLGKVSFQYKGDGRRVDRQQI